MAGGLLVLFLGMYSWNQRTHTLDDIAANVGLEMSGTVLGTFDSVKGSVMDAWRRYVDLVGVREENERLRAQVAELQARIVSHGEDLAELARLRELVQLPVDSAWKPVGARILAGRMGPNAIQDSITINRGYTSGARPGTPIVTNMGLVGRVLRASPHAATVLLITDPGSRIAVFAQQSRSAGILSGQGLEQPLEVGFVERDAPVTAGEILITSGLDGKYPKGIPVATVDSVAPSDSTQFLAVTARPLVDVRRLEEVLLLEPSGINRPLRPSEPAPDFVGGGQILYDEAQMRDIFENGRGSVKVRARYAAVPGENMIEITQIPPTTTVEAIMDKIAELVKTGKVKEISDMRDETDLNGLKLTLDLKRGVDADKLMAKLFKATPLEDSFSCNFNILVSGQPRVMGVREILQEWTAFRMECVRRRTYYDLHGKEKRLHLLKGLAAILMDIDKAIHIIRTTEEETEVVPNLMIGFGIDEVQADYVAEIKLRHLNREYILKRTGEIEQLEADIADLNDILAKPARIRRIIIKELGDVAKKYGQPRRSEILYDLPEEEGGAEEEAVPDYPVTVFFTREGYLKKIPPQSLRTAGAHKLKEGDEIIRQVETRNNVEALFFTDRQQVYKVRLAELEDGKVAQMGIYLPGRLGMDEGEAILSMVITSDYSGQMLFFFASGKCAKIPLSSYATKQNRRKLLKAYCDKEPLAAMLFLPEETELAIRTSAGRMLLVSTAQIAAKATRDSQGVAVVTLKKNQTIASVVPADTLELANPHRYRVRSLPATGALIRAEDEGEQMTLL